MDRLSAFSMLVLVAVLAGAGPFIAGGLLYWSKRRARARRRSPLTSDLLRAPGYGIRLRLDAVRDEVDMCLLVLVTAPLTVYAVHLTQSYAFRVPETLTRVIVNLVASFAVIGWMSYRLLSFSRRLDQLRVGLDAEMAIGQELDQLMRSGAAVFHDVPAEGWNIDHVLICETGVYSVETKGRPKPIRGRGSDDAKVIFDGTTLRFPTWVETKPLAQAERQAAWLGKWLQSAVAAPVSPIPVLAIPGWFIERKGRSSVLVTNGKRMDFLLRYEGQRLSKEMIQRIAHQVEQRCRTVKPTYLPKQQKME